eukprot:gene28870-35172_t
MTVFHVRLESGRIIKAASLNAVRTVEDPLGYDDKVWVNFDTDGAAMQKLIASVVSRLVISVPYLWMLIFFLIPFIIVFKISLSQVTMAIPPYTPTIDVWAGWQGLINSVSQFSWDNYTFLGSD